MKALKFILFCILGIFYFPLYLFVHYTHGKVEEKGWYPTLWKSKNIFKKLLAIILWPIYFFATKFLDATFEWFEKLSE